MIFECFCISACSYKLFINYIIIFVLNNYIHQNLFDCNWTTYHDTFWNTIILTTMFTLLKINMKLHSPEADYIDLPSLVGVQTIKNFIINFTTFQKPLFRHHIDLFCSPGKTYYLVFSLIVIVNDIWLWFINFAFGFLF